MYHRFFAAALRLLNPNTFQSPDNPIQVDRLPDHSGVELDYPVYQDPPTVNHRRTVVLIMATLLAAPAIGWLARILPYNFYFGAISTVHLILAGACTALGVFSWRQSSWPYWPALVVVPILMVLDISLPILLVGYTIIVVAQCVLADRLMTHYLFLKTAAPVPQSTAVQVRALWKNRFSSMRRPLRGTELYLVPYSLVIPFTFYVILLWSQHDSADFDTIASFLRFVSLTLPAIIVAVVFESLVAFFYGRRRYRLTAQVRATWRAIEEWVNYNRLNTRAPGVHHSPAGLCFGRRILLIGYLLGWTYLWFGSQSSATSFPSFFEQAFPKFFGEIPLVRQFLTDDQPFDRMPAPPDPSLLPSAGDDRPLVPLLELSRMEQEFLTRVSPEERDKYVAERQLLHEQRYAAERLQKDRNSSSDKSAALVIRLFDRLVAATGQVLLPVLAILLASGCHLIALCGRSLAAIESLLGSEPRKRIFSTDNWDYLVQRVQKSDDEKENQSVLVGVNARDDTPILVPREVFREHAHILGDSGSGKTSIGLLPLICQLMRTGECSIVVIDLKADDQLLMDSLAFEAKKISKQSQNGNPPESPVYPFRWFTTVIGRSSFAFNPLAQSFFPKLSPDQRTDMLTAALGLQYGTDYGRLYFGDANFDVLNYALRANPDVSSFAELEQILAGAERFPLPEEIRKRAGTHVRTSVRRLSRNRALNACRKLGTPEAVLSAAIDIDQIFSQPQVLYFALPPAAGTSTTAQVARIVLHALLYAAQCHAVPRTQVFLCVDEFQRIVSNNVELFLQQARSMDIGCILSNQSLSDLQKVDADLVSAVRTNTRFRQVFGAATVEDITDLIDTGGQAVYGLRTWKYDPGLWDNAISGTSIAETVSTRLSTNDILLATDAPGRSITCVRRGAGYAQYGGMPFVMDSVHHISFETFERRRDKAWPDPDLRTLVATIEDDSIVAIPEGPSILGIQSDAPPLRREIEPATTSSSPESAANSAAEADSHDFQLDDMLREQQRQAHAWREKRKPKKKRTPRPPNPPRSQ